MAENINITIEEVSTDINLTVEEVSTNINITMDVAAPTNWGTIGGSIENQLDLQTKLSGYVSTENYVATDNNYSNSDKSKLDGIQSGAEVNINPDWNASSGDAQILNKPDITSIARQSISETVEGLSYANSTGVLSLTSGYIIPTLTSFNNKVDSELGKGLSENNFSDTLKSKLDGIETGAQVNIISSVNTQTGAVVLNTSHISENTNLYYTNERADARISAQKGAINGIASLDGSGKVPSSQLPVQEGGIEYMGTWDASTGNYPTATPNDGEFWIITVAGTIATVLYAVGDWIIYKTNSGWSRVPSGATVTSVNSKTGTVVLTTTDIAQGTNEYYTETKVNNNTEVQKGVTANNWGNHASAGYAQDSAVVHDTGNETIYGNKTFDDTVYINDRLNVGSSTFDLTNPEFLKVDGGTSASVNIISAYSNYDDYVQLNIKNNNSGEYASSDFVATADIGQEGANYIDMGINNSNYASPEFNIVEALDGYCFVDGGNLALGTASADKNLILFTGGTLQENKRGELSDTALSLSVNISAPNISNIDNTSDLNKPISTATQNAINNLATKTEVQNARLFAIAMAVAL